MKLVILIELVPSFFNPFKATHTCHLALENKCKIGRTKKKDWVCKYFKEKQSTKKKAGSLLESLKVNCV